MEVSSTNKQINTKAHKILHLLLLDLCIATVSELVRISSKFNY